MPKITNPAVPAENSASRNPRSFTFYVRRIINSKDRSVRSFRLSHAIRGELEIETYGREFLEHNFSDPNTVLCMPQLTFIDGFGVYRNMYRSLTGIYMIPSNLPMRERNRLANIFPITLGPHGSSLDDVLSCLEPASKALEKGVMMQLNLGRGSEHTKEIRVCTFALGYLGDTPQQNENAGFLRSNALFGCRACLIPSKQYDDLKFDTRVKGRYHHEVPQPNTFSTCCSSIVIPYADADYRSLLYVRRQQLCQRLHAQSSYRQ